jgi:hypothetical protein
MSIRKTKQKQRDDGGRDDADVRGTAKIGKYVVALRPVRSPRRREE